MCNMFYFIVFFVFNICVCVQSAEKNSYNTTIDFQKLDEGGSCANKEIIIVKNNGPFNITFTYSEKITDFSECCNNANLNPCATEKHADCYKLGTEIVSDFRRNITIIQVLNTTKYIDTRWICTFWKLDNFKLPVTFVIKVKNIEDKPTVEIGGEKTTPTIAPVKEYDYIYYYWYNDGELMDLDCYRNSRGKIRLRYMSSNGTTLIKTDQIETETPKLTFRKILTTVNNGDIIDCEFNKNNNSFTKIVQRTILKFKNDSAESVFKIIINNQTLHPMDKDGEKNLYRYKYLEGDLLNVTCLINIGHLSFGKENNENLKSNIREDTSLNNVWRKAIELHTIYNTQSIDKKQLTCENNVNNKAVIEFRLDQRELAIKGLHAKNVINEYKKNERKWIIDYNYTIGETLNLECVAREDKEVLWILQKDKIKIIRNIYKHTFVLEDELNGKIITCQTKDSKDKIQRVNVKFHETVKSSEITTEPLKVSAESYDIIIPVACLLVVIVIGVMAVCFRGWSRKIKLSRAEQEPDLSIPPYPVQWNNRLQNQTNYEGYITDYVLNNSNAQIYPSPQTKNQNENTDEKYINKNKPIPKIESNLNDKSQTMVVNSMYNINNTPKYCNAHKNESIQSINNEEVAEYHYIEPNALFNLKEDIMKNIPKDTSPKCSNMKTNDGFIYVEPYASIVQAQSSNVKEGDYDYVYAGRYGNNMACGVNFNGRLI